MPATPRADRQRSYVLAIAAGSSRTAAAALAGVDRTVAWRWLQRPVFARRVEAAEAEFERRAVDRIEQAARRGSWRAQAFLLERRLPQQWQQRSTLAVEGDFGSELTPEEWRFVEDMRSRSTMTEPELQAEEDEFVGLSIDHTDDPTRLRAWRDRIDRQLGSRAVRVAEGVTA